jgi:hypothetical protein
MPFSYSRILKETTVVERAFQKNIFIYNSGRWKLSGPGDERQLLRKLRKACKRREIKETLKELEEIDEEVEMGWGIEGRWAEEDEEMNWEKDTNKDLWSRRWGAADNSEDIKDIWGDKDENKWKDNSDTEEDRKESDKEDKDKVDEENAIEGSGVEDVNDMDEMADWGDLGKENDIDTNGLNELIKEFFGADESDFSDEDASGNEDATDDATDDEEDLEWKETSFDSDEEVPIEISE